MRIIFAFIMVSLGTGLAGAMPLGDFAATVEASFSQDDLRAMAFHKFKFGLRHLSSEQRAVSESREKNIGQGCSLNVSPQSCNFVQAFEVDPSPTFVSVYNQGIDDFIKNSIFFDFNQVPGLKLIETGRSPRSDLSDVLRFTRFVLVVYPEYAKSVDHMAWGRGMGRFPTYAPPAVDVIKLPAVEIAELGLTEEQLRLPITGSQYQEDLTKIINLLRTKIVIGIRAYLTSLTAPAAVEPQ